MSFFEKKANSKIIKKVVVEWISIMIVSVIAYEIQKG